MEHLADANWLGRLEVEYRRRREGPARKILATNKVFIEPVAHCEFLTLGETPFRWNLLRRLKRLAFGLDYQTATQAAALRLQQRKKGRSLHTPDALIAATAIRQKMQLLTADKDFSGIPGLKWSSYRD